MPAAPPAGYASSLNEQALAPEDRSVGVSSSLCKHLVVDSGALIRLENLHGLAEEYWTIQEVLSEVRDKAAREALKRLPFELKVREPSDDAIQDVVSFAKNAGELYGLSRPDIKVIALALMIHKEMHGSKGLRGSPAEEESGLGTDLSHYETERGTTSQTSLQNESDTLTDSNTLVSDLKHCGNEPTFKEKTVGSTNASISGDPGRKIGWAVPSLGEQVAAKDLKCEGLCSSEATIETEGENSDKIHSGTKEPEWPSLQDIVDPNEQDKYAREKDFVSMQLAKVEKSVRTKSLARKKKAEAKVEKLAKALESVKLESDQDNEGEKEKYQRGSRLLGSGGIDVVDVEEQTESSKGWVTLDTLPEAGSLFGLSGSATNSFSEGKANVPEFDPQVACVTTDYAMQNVMIQMRLKLITLEGRKIQTVRRFVLKCDSCFKICKKLDKQFCPDCGNATLARLNYSIGSDGVVHYHYKKNRKVNTRGMKYSLPKPRGGRQGDLLLAEDQLLNGWWSQHSKKKNSSTSMFGEQVSESLGVDVNSNGKSLRIGYGRQNPNAAKGRERRGKKVKRRDKRPGCL